MDIIKIAVIGLIGAILATTVRSDKGFSFFVSIATGIVILFVAIPMLGNIFNNFVDISNSIGINSKYIVVMLKSIGIAYVSMFSSQLCRDFGQGSIADKIELGGKVVIMINAMTIVNQLIDEMLGFIVWKV